MLTYNKIMRYVWLIGTIVSFLIVTIMGIKEGFKTWVHFYTFPVIGLMMFLMKSWMMKRMEKHLQYLEQQKEQSNNR